jgi:gliding motility-associated-like protein
VTVTVNGTTYTTTANSSGNWSITTNTLPSGTYSVTAKATDAVGNVSPVGIGSLQILSNTIIKKPTEILDITKISNTAKMNLDGSFNIDFIIKVKNLSIDLIDSILVQDDLTRVFSDTRGISVVALEVSGNLLKNNNYDGVTDKELLLIKSALDSKMEDSIKLTVKVASNVSGNFENTAIAKVPTSFGVINLSSTDPTQISSISDTIRKPTIFAIPLVEVLIPGGFSPNNDGIDDNWVIKRPFGTTISVKVFNRWGNEVYSNSNYQNNWSGKGVSNFIGEDVPSGTYFYIVEATDMYNVKRKFASSLTIVR